jgi:hypothetical protein
VAAVPVVLVLVSELEPAPLEGLEAPQAVVPLLFLAPLDGPAREPALVAPVALLPLPEAQEPAQEPVLALVAAEAPPQLPAAEPEEARTQTLRRRYHSGRTIFQWLAAAKCLSPGT